MKETKLRTLENTPNGDKHEAKFIMNQSYEDHKAYGWESSYAYSLIVGGFLHYISKHNFPPTLEE
jgi:hypothetical protein